MNATPVSQTASPPKHVGIVMMSAVGDTVHVLPVVTALKRHGVQRVTWVLQPGPASLVRGHPSVDEIIVFQRSLGIKAFDRVRRELAARRFDVVLAMQTYFKAGIVTSFANAPRKIGFDRARSKDLSWLFANEHLPPRPLGHIQDDFLEFLDPLGIPAEPLTWNIGPWTGERDTQRRLLGGFDRPIVSLVIGSSKPDKDWPADRWARLCDALVIDFGLQPVLVGGRSARESATERVILEQARHKPVSLLDSGLRPLVGILDGSALVISLDTGPLHMSVALQRPVIALMGYTDPRRTGPYRRYHDLICDAFHDAREEGPITRETRLGRMPRITVDQVLARVERWRERYSREESRVSVPKR